MAQADWDFNLNGSGSIVGGNDGAARVNASLSNPLTGEGTFCREYASANVNDKSVAATIKDTVQSGDFFQIPVTKSISVRAYLRHSDLANGQNFQIGIAAKSNASPAGDKAQPESYSILLTTPGSSPPATNRVIFRARAGGGGPQQFQEDTGIVVVNNTWIHLRMDIIPTGVSEDNISVFTGVGPTGSEVWTLEYTKTILSSDGFYIPWAQSGAGKVGFWTVYDTTSGPLMHIDRFQAFLEEV